MDFQRRFKSFSKTRVNKKHQSDAVVSFLHSVVPPDASRKNWQYYASSTSSETRLCASLLREKLSPSVHSISILIVHALPKLFATSQRASQRIENECHPCSWPSTLRPRSSTLSSSATCGPRWTLAPHPHPDGEKPCA